MASTDFTARTVPMTSRTVPFSANPIVAAVARIRDLQDDLTPRQLEVREAGRQQVRDMLATGAFSLAPRH